jgi:hypothetical protein
MKDLQAAAYNQEVKITMMNAIIGALDEIEQSTYVSSERIEEIVNGLQIALEFINSAEV